MERARVRACLLTVAAAVIAALAVNATGPHPANAWVDVVATPVMSPAPANEGHVDPTPVPTPAPTPTPADDADAHGHHASPMPSGPVGATPSGHGDDGHEVGHASAAPSSDPHGHGDPGATSSGSPVPHETAGPGSSHSDHGTTEDHGSAEDDQGEQPREAVIGGFFVLNGLVLAAAAFIRRRDRVRAAARVTPISRKDASR